MHAQNAFVNDSRNWEVVKHCAEFTPHRKIVPSFAFIIETIHSCNRAALMISSQQEYMIRVLYLVSNQHANGFDALFTTVNKVSDKQVLVNGWGTSTHLKQTQQIIKLTVEVACDLNWRVEFEECGFLLENVLDFFD